MTLPGLALFYGGLVRRKNMLSVMAQCLGCAGLVTILWWAVGYSFAFAPGSSILGGTKFAMLKGVTSAPNGDYAAWVSQNVFSMYQLMFAIITPGLIVGAIAERMKYSAVMAFITVWMSVVHMSSGWSALVLCLILGKRTGWGKRAFLPHSLTLTMVGTGMLWVGWYGFNAGSAVAADGIAANAFMTTTLAAAIAGATWPTIEWLTRGKPTILGFCSGIVGGLVVITPAAGFVTASGAVIIGVLAGVVPYLACTKLKSIFKYDDALDTFGVHAVGGTLGALVTGFLANPEANPNLNTNLAGIVGKTLWLEQLKAIGLTLTLAIGGTAIIAYALKAVMGLRPSIEQEEAGLDETDHGEAAYHPDEGGFHGQTTSEAAVAAAPVLAKTS
jgi:Amt family ammonium transporter